MVQAPVESIASEAIVEPFACLDEMRAEQSTLLRAFGHAEGNASHELLTQARRFLARGRATGSLLEGADDRWDAQSMLNYWSTVVFRHGRDAADDPPITILSEFGGGRSVSIAKANFPHLSASTEIRDEAIGRPGLLSDLRARLLKGGNIALYGSTGMGKTSIAARLAQDRAVKDRYPDGTLWANLGDRSDIASILDNWGKSLGLEVDELHKLASIEDRRRYLRRVLSHRRVLIAIDDAWDAEAAAELKLGGAECVHLLTTYELSVALAFDAEGTVAVGGMSAHDGRRLLESLDSQFRGFPDDDIEQLVQLVNGSPLALSLIARCSASLDQRFERRCGITELLQKVSAQQSTFERERVTSRLALPATRTPASLLAAIAWCVQQLEAEDEAVLRALSAFPPKPNSFSEPAARHVAAADDGKIAALLAAGLLERFGSDRLCVHRAVADYLKVTSRDRTDDAGQRLAQFFLAAASSRASDSALYEREDRNMIAALDIAYDRGAWREYDQDRWLEIVSGTMAFVRHLDRTGLYRPAKQQLTRARKVAKARSDERTLAKFNLSLGEMEERLGQYSRAVAHLRAALKVARSLDDSELSARALQGLGVVSLAQGENPVASRYFKQALRLANELGDVERQGAIYTRLGWVATNSGQYEQAKQYAQTALKLASTSDVGQIAQLKLSLGVIAFYEHEFERARDLYKRGLEIAGDRDSRLRCALLQALGGVEIELQQYDDAETHLFESLRLSRDMGYRWYTSVIWKELGELRLRQSALHSAADAFVKSLNLAQELDSPEPAGLALWGLGRVAAARHMYVDARLQGLTSHSILAQIDHLRAREVAAWLNTLPR